MKLLINSGSSTDAVKSADQDQAAPNNVVAFPARQGTDLYAQVEALEERLILEAMTATGNNQVQAARRLGITRGALQYKLKKLASKIPRAA